MEPQYIQETIQQLEDEQAWNHNFELAPGIVTSNKKQSSHGKNLVKWERVKPILDKINLDNKKVLDIGCNEGFFSTKLAGYGSDVLGGDVDPLRIKKANFVNSVLQLSNVEFRVLDIYSETFKNLQKFDFCLCMGFLHRIPDPYTAIEILSKKTDMILFEWKALKHGPHDDSFAYFSRKNINQKDYYGTEYWILSYTLLETILRRFGFKYFYRVDDPTQKRAILLAGKEKNEVFNQVNVIKHRGRVAALLSHTKRYIKSVYKVLTGELNS